MKVKANLGATISGFVVVGLLSASQARQDVLLLKHESVISVLQPFVGAMKPAETELPLSTWVKSTNL